MPTELFISYKREPASIRLAQVPKAHVEEHFLWVHVGLDETGMASGALIQAYMAGCAGKSSPYDFSAPHLPTKH
jgi:hypothetical protein